MRTVRRLTVRQHSQLDLHLLYVYNYDVNMSNFLSLLKGGRSFRVEEYLLKMDISLFFYLIDRV